MLVLKKNYEKLQKKYDLLKQNFDEHLAHTNNVSNERLEQINNLEIEVARLKGLSLFDVCYSKDEKIRLLSVYAASCETKDNLTVFKSTDNEFIASVSNVITIFKK